jgi:hypothetical protein
MRILPVFAFALLLALPVWAQTYDGIISDGHAHFKRKKAKPNRTIQAMDRNKIDVMVLWVKSKGGWKDNDTLEFAAKYPGRVIPGIAFQNKGWTRNKKTFLEKVFQKASSGRFKALGEMSFRGKIGGKPNAAPDSPHARVVLDISEKFNLPLTIHHNAFERTGGQWVRTDEYQTFVDATLAYNPRAHIVWDHWCGQSTPADAGRLLRRFPNLVCGLAWLHKPSSKLPTPLLDGEGRFLPAWKKLIEANPARFIIGIDANSAPGPLRNFDARVGMFRKALGGLSPRTAARVASGNLHRIYGLD